MVQITELAAKEVKTIMEQQQEAAGQKGQDAPQLYLRVGVKGGGCSGFNYSLDFADVVAENDERSSQHGVEIICDPKSALYLEGTTIDFRNELTGRGFVFNNPNATNTCGCGSSFAV